MFRNRDLWAAASGLCLLASLAPCQTFVRKIPNRPALGVANDVAVDAAGNMWVAGAFDELVKLDARGNELFRIARQFRSGTGANQMFQPTSVAMGHANDVYVATKQNYVVRFDLNGNYLGAFGGPGAANGQFGGTSCGGLAVAANGDVLAVDIGGHRVQRFDASGSFLMAFGSPGSGAGQFDFVDGVIPMQGAGIVEDVNGDILVVDRGNQRVQRFDASGAPLSSFTTSASGSFGGALSDIVIDGGGRILVSGAAAQLQAFNAAGTLLQNAFPSFGGFAGAIQGLGLDAAGNVFAASSAGGRVLQLNSSLAAIAAFGNPYQTNTDGVFAMSSGQVLFDANGDLRVGESQTLRLQRFDGNGAFVSKLNWAPAPGTGVNAGFGLARDSAGSYYVAGSAGGVQCVHKFSAAGVYVQSVGNFGSNLVRGIAVDAADTLWVSTGSNVSHLDATGTPVVTIATTNAFGVALDRAGRVYIADATLGVRVHEPNGALVSTVTATGLFARSVLVDGSGRIFVGSSNGGVSIFNPAGVKLVTFGARGTGDGDITSVSSLALHNGLLAVADPGANRVQIFDVSLLDQQIPVVQILAPALTNATDGAVVTANTIPVTVHVQDDSATTVTSNMAGVFGLLPAGGGQVTGSVVYPLGVDGSFNLAVNAADASGNVAGTTRMVTRDTAPPVFGSVTPADGTVFGTAAVNLVVNVADLTSKTLVVSHGGGSFAQAGSTLLTATVPVTLLHGTNTILLEATDAAGHVTTMTRTLIADFTVPIVEFVGLGGPSDPDCFGPGQSLLPVTVGVTDLSATTVSSSPAGVSGALPAGGGFVTGAVTLVEGANTITVSASDGYRSASAVVNVTYDVTAPTLAFDSPGPSEVVQGTMHVVAAADDDFANDTPGCGIATMVFTIDGNLVEMQAGNGDGLYELDFDTTTLANGTHVLVATATDGVGNAASASVTFVVDNAPPVSLTFDFAPDSLNLKNKGQGVVTAHLEGASVPSLVPIASHTIELRVRGGNAVGALAAGGVGDADDDQIPDLTIRFDRSALIASIKAGILGNLLPANGTVDVELWIDGALAGSSPVQVKT